MDGNMLKWYPHPQIKLTHQKKKTTTKTKHHETQPKKKKNPIMNSQISACDFSLKLKHSVHYPKERTGFPHASIPTICVLILKTIFQS